MRTSLETTLNFTLHSEGVYQCLRSDPGNWTGGRVGSGQLVGTKYGLSAPLVAQRVPELTAQKMRLLSQDDFRDVAVKQFWNPLHCDDLPVGIDLLVFDHGFNTGLKPAVRLVQHIAGVTDDGVVGAATLQAVARATPVRLIPYLNCDMIVMLQNEMLLEETGAIDTDMRARLNDARWFYSLWCCALASLQDVDYRQKRGFSTFGRGWLNRVRERVSKSLELCREQRLQTSKTVAIT